MSLDDPAPWRPPAVKRPREPHKAAIPRAVAPLSPPALPQAPSVPKRPPRAAPARRPAPVVSPEVRAHAARVGAARRRLRGIIRAAYDAAGLDASAPAWTAYDAAPGIIQRVWRDRAEMLFSLEQLEP